MASDIVFPKGNENALISMAKRLGYDGLTLVYEYDRSFRRLSLDSLGLSLRYGLLCSPSDIEKAQGLCDFILVRSGPKDRYVIERQKPDMMFGLESLERKDSLHARNSGLNQVLCTLMSKNDISLGISFSSLLRCEHLLRATLLGRMMQNIILCQKYKVNIMLASFASDPLGMRNPKDLLSLARLIGIRQNI